MTEIHGFKLIEERNIPDINSHARLFKHIKTGAELLSLENDDENKSFMVALRTPPPDDTGIPHIMEHSVLLGGTQKYQVKEPFLELLKTSVNTFINAFTASDMTVYPIASTNLQDFYNLIDVYLDSVFFPLISPEILMQEGWHHETKGEDAPLTYKGVVFNEMKASYSVPESVLRLAVNRALFPDTPYSNSSSGVPAAIPDLTYEQFKEFHETFYHPSNARFVFSGDDNPEERLRIVNEALKQFDAKEIDSELPLQPKFSSPTKVIEGYDFGENAGENQTMIQMSWLLPEITDMQTMMELSVLSHALVSTSASPLRKVLTDSGLGEGLVGGGLDDNTRQASFRIGLKGISEENAEPVENLILETLGNLAEEGIDKDTVKAAINTFEFSLRERNYGSFPRGLANALASMSSWIHGANPIEALSFGKHLDTVKQRFEEDDEYFEQMIGKYLIDNSHRVTVILNPDPDVGPTRDKAEFDRLAKTKADMDDEELKAVVETQAKLEELQETPNDPKEVAKIPTLSLGDIERKIKTVEQEIIEQDDTIIYFHNQPTGGITYFSMGLDLRTLPQELLPYIELFGTALTKMGTETEDFVKLSQRIGMKTGGIGASVNTTMKRDGSDFFAYMMVGGKVMTDNSQDMLDIIKDILLTVKLDNQERFKQILLERKVGMERYLALAGHAIVSKRTRSYFNLSDWATEQMSGTENLFFIRDLVDKVENDWDSVLKALESIRETLVNRAGMIVNVTMEGEKWTAFKAQLDNFLTALPKNDASQQTWEMSDEVAYEGLTLPAQSYFNGKTANIYKHGYKLHGSVSVITKYLSRDYMWHQLRVLGGAYGGNISFSIGSGLVSYLSWRDPNIVKTLETFTNAADYLKSLEMSDSDMEKVIIGAIGALDSHDLPDAKGYKAMMRHLVGYSDEMRQQYRDEVLETKLENFYQFGEILEKIGDEARVAVVASPDALKEADEALGGKFKMTKLQ